VVDTAFRALVENAPDAIVVSRQGVVLYANAATARLLGCDDVSELVGKPMTFLDRTQVEVMMRRIQQMAATGERLVPREYPARRRDGTAITAEIASTIIDYDGAPAVLAYARDVTDRKRLQTQLAHADRLAALGTMAAGLAHELNNPLSFIGLAAEMLARHDGPVDPNVVAELQRGVDRITSIVRELRFFGRDDGEVSGPVDLRSAIEAAARLVAHEVRPRGTLDLQLGELPAVVGVGRRFEQVFVDLLLNAALSLDEGSGGRIVVRSRVTAERVYVTVEDRGRGIAGEHLAEPVQPLFPARPDVGASVGLSVCRDILGRAGGELSARSREGEGTVMEVMVPRAASAQAEAPASRGPDAPESDGTRGPESSAPRVLVIDDEPVIVRMVSKILAPRARVVGESDPAKGLEHALSGSFDVILCDVMMPGLTGIDLHERLARDRPDVAARVVFITGGTYTSRAREYLDKVPNGRLDKPFNVKQLFEAVQSVEVAPGVEPR
jgi:PAS domain S-box-containing protein